MNPLVVPHEDGLVAAGGVVVLRVDRGALSARGQPPVGLRAGGVREGAGVRAGGGGCATPPRRPAPRRATPPPQARRGAPRRPSPRRAAPAHRATPRGLVAHVRLLGDADVDAAVVLADVLPDGLAAELLPGRGEEGRHDGASLCAGQVLVRLLLRVLHLRLAGRGRAVGAAVARPITRACTRSATRTSSM